MVALSQSLKDIKWVSALLFFSVGHASTSLAQQETYLTHAAFNRMLFNPAFAGYQGKYEITSFHHRQWVGLLDNTGKYRTEDHQPSSDLFPSTIAPEATGFTFSAPITRCKDGEKQELAGYGISMLQDVIGYEANTAVKLSAAVAVNLTGKSKLRWGLDLNFLTKRLNTALLRAHQNPDPLIPVGQNPADSKLILGTGWVYENPDFHSLYAAFSISGLNHPLFMYSNAAGNPIHIKTATHAYFVTSGQWESKSAQITYSPTIMIRSTSDGKGWVSPQAELQCMAEYKHKFSAGAGIRGQYNGVDAISFLTAFYPKRLSSTKGHLRLGYAFDLTLQDLRQSSRNTHEIQLNYTFHRPCRIKTLIRHPRDLKFNLYRIEED